MSVKVLHVIGPMLTGGAQTQLLGLVRAAHRKYWDATVVATSAGPMSEHFRDAGIPFIELRRLASPGLLRVRALRRIVADHDFEVVNSFLWQANAYARLAVVGRRDRPAVVISERNVEVDRSALRRHLDRVLAHWTDLWIGNSEAVVEFIRRTHPVAPDQVVHIPNAVDREVFSPGAAAETGDGVRIGTVARLAPEKGIDSLIQAFRLLCRDGDLGSSELLIAGEGPERSRLVELAVGLPVHFVGLLPPGEPTAAFLRTLDVFVLPSREREGRPNALIEAVACGVPAVATDIEGVREVSGVKTARPHDPPSLASAIREVVADPSARQRSIAAASQFLDFEQLAERYLGVFRRAEDARRWH